MKKPLVFLLSLVMLFSAAACGAGTAVGKGEVQLSSSEMSLPENAAPSSSEAAVDADFFANLSDADAWSSLDGYWNGPEGQFVCFSTSPDGMCIEYGVWGTSFSTGTGVVGAFSLRSAEAGQFGVTADFPAVPANEMDDGREAFSAAYGLDLFDLERDGKIKFDVDGVWEVYTFGGATAEEAYNAWLSGTTGDAEQQSVPADDVLVLDTTGVWGKLAGYWTAAEGRCIGFGFDGDTKTFEELIFETEFGYIGTIFELSESGDNLFEAVGKNTSDRPFTVQLDVGGLEQDGKINVKIDDGSWYTYAFGGATVQDAQASLY